VKRRYVGNYAQEIKVGDTYVQTAPGDFLELSAEDEDDVFNKEMIDGGILIEGEPPKEDTADKPATGLTSKGGDK
jgi:hypothetical protein